MNKIPTAEEFCNERLGFEEYGTDVPYFMIQFAKFHVKTALKKASEKAFVEYIDLETNKVFDYTDVITDDGVGVNINKNSILNAYSLENIK